MGIGVSLFLLALGAILAYGVNVDAEGFNLNTIGWILMIVGILGAVLSAFFWSSWGGSRGSRRDERVVERERI